MLRFDVETLKSFIGRTIAVYGPGLALVITGTLEKIDYTTIFVRNETELLLVSCYAITHVSVKHG